MELKDDLEPGAILLDETLTLGLEDETELKQDLDWNDLELGVILPGQLGHQE